MNTTFLWPTLAIIVVATIWQTVYSVRRLGREDEPTPRKPLLQMLFSALFQWGVIIAAVILGYLTAGILGSIGVILALLVLPMVATFLILAAAGRIRRR